MCWQVWEKYDDATSTRIEKAHQKSQKTTKVDDDRFIDFASMTQRRRDDPTKQRTVKRVLPGASPDDDPTTTAAATSTTTAAAAAVASTAAPVTRRAAAKKTVVDEGVDGVNLDTDDSDVEVEWFWAGDSPGGGHQDVRVPYSAAMGGQIEKSYGAKQKVMKVDDERYIDLKELTQRRYDDKNKRRALFRVKKRVPRPTPAPVVVAPAPVVVAPTPAPVPVAAPVTTPAPVAVTVNPPPASAPAPVSVPAPAPAATSAPAAGKTAAADDDGSCTEDESDSKTAGKRKTRSASTAGTAAAKRQKTGPTTKNDDDDGSCTEDESDTKGKAKGKGKGKEPTPTPTAPASSSATAVADADDDGDDVSWFWAGDGAKGHQDIWVQYDATMTKKLEDAFQAGLDEMKVDDQRYVDLKSKPMLQRRYDDKMKRRTIKRTVKKKKKAALAVVTSAASSSSSATPAPATAATAAPASTPAADAIAPGPKLKLELDEENTKITKVTQQRTGSSDGLASSASSDSINLKKVGHNMLPGCPATWTDEEGMDYYELNVDPKSDEYKRVSKMLTDTVEGLHCHNPSNHKVTFGKLEVARIVRVQNPALWLRYQNRRQKISQSKKGLAPLTKVATGASSDPAANEFYLFHGLNHGFLDEITQFGFDPRHCSLDGMFGAGLYFADSSSKSNQYTHSGVCGLTGMAGLQQQQNCKCKKTDEACVLLCRCTLGEPFIEVKFQGNSPGQFWHGRRKEPTKPDGSLVNSVVGESRTNVAAAYLQFREYIVSHFSFSFFFFSRCADI